MSDCQRYSTCVSKRTHSALFTPPQYVLEESMDADVYALMMENMLAPNSKHNSCIYAVCDDKVSRLQLALKCQKCMREVLCAESHEIVSGF